VAIIIATNKTKLPLAAPFTAPSFIDYEITYFITRAPAKSNLSGNRRKLETLAKSD